MHDKICQKTRDNFNTRTYRGNHYIQNSQKHNNGKNGNKAQLQLYVDTEFQKYQTGLEQDKIPAADFRSYWGTVKAGLSPSKTLDTVDDTTEANMIIAVVNGGEFSALRGLKTVSIAKKQPATAALKPES